MAKPIPPYEDGMPRVEPETGRKIVQVVADNPNGWRYMYEDDMDPDGDEPEVLYVPKAAGWDKPAETTTKTAKAS